MRLADTGALTPEPTEIEGVYIRADVAPEDFEAVSAKASELEDADTQSEAMQDLFYEVYDKLLCDSEGNRFEDFPTRAESRIGIFTGMRWVRAVFGASANLGKGLPGAE